MMGYIYSMKRIIPVFLFSVFALGAMPAKAVEIIFTFNELRNTKGHILCTLHDNEEAFPRDSAKAFRSKIAPIRNGKAICMFKNLPLGTYAATLAHDENDNRKVDLGALGLPLEGFAFSNNAKPDFFGPPSFDEAAIRLDSGGTAQEISFIYPEESFK